MPFNLKDRIGGALTGAGKAGSQSNMYRRLGEQSSTQIECVGAGGMWVKGVCIPKEMLGGGSASMSANLLDAPITTRPRNR